MLIRLMRRTARAHRGPLAAVVALQLTGTAATLLLPRLQADLVDAGVVPGDTRHLLRVGAVMGGVALLQVVCAVAAVRAGARTAAGVGRDVRAALFAHVGRLSAREVNRFGAPTLVTRTTNDVQQVQTFVLIACTVLVTAPIICVGGVVMAVREQPGLSWLVAATVPVLVAVSAVVLGRMVPTSRLLQSRVDTLNRILREQITGIRVVRGFVRERHETARFAAANAGLTAATTTAGRLQATVFPIVLLLLNGSSAAVLWFGAARVEDGRMGIGSLTAFVTYLLQILMSVLMVTPLVTVLPRASVCARRILEVLDTAPSAAAATRVRTPRPTGEVVLDGVGFRHPGAARPVLSGVTVTAGPGRTTAVVGGTGAGKTTLLSLVPRLLDVTEGSVTVDGVDVREQDPDALRRGIGLVPQRAFLFAGTVADNLRHGDPDATPERMWEALRVAQADGFVRDRPGGLDSTVASGGSDLSGGQRQRLAIARALVRRPRVYLFDDAFSALDQATDARLRAALAVATADATVVVVAQRVATVRDADRIVVLDGGAVVGSGRHDELVRDCTTYREIVESQADAEVLA